jgi:prepilin-type processing-associated H-X9-DG protein
MPAVQKVREAASRSQCMNNLRQIGLALHNYHDPFRHLPPSDTTTPQRKHSWVAFILPFIEQSTLYNRYDFKANWFSPKNQQVVSAQLRLFQCPSVPIPDRTDPAFPSLPACGDYNATKNVATGLVSIGLVPPTDLRGVMMTNQTCRLTDITDGTSNTILIAEDAGRPQLYTSTAVPGGYAAGGGWADRRGPFTLSGSSLDGTMPFGPCSMNCTNDNEIFSFHTGGANLLFADGSVQYLHQAINIRTMAALITRSGNEPVSAAEW